MIIDMLEYNPFFRPTAKELLKSTIFDEIRVDALERNATQTIEILSDELIPIDYGTGRVIGLEKNAENSKLVVFFFKIEILKEIQLLRGIKIWGTIFLITDKFSIFTFLPIGNRNSNKDDYEHIQYWCMYYYVNNNIFEFIIKLGIQILYKNIIIRI